MSSAAPTTAPPLSIAIIGVGKIGSTFAYRLAQAGHKVTAIARPGSKRLQQLQRDQGIIDVKGERADVITADELDVSEVYDLIIVTTLAHQVDAVIPALRKNNSVAIHFMFNTFDPERLQRAVGAQRVSFGMPMVVASLTPDGKLRSMISAKRKTVHGDERWAKLFDESGIPSSFENDMMGWLRCQAAVCVAMESISIAAKRRGGGSSWKEATIAARGSQAIFKIIKQLGFRVFPRPQAMMSSAPTFLVAAMLWMVSRVPPIRNAMANGVNECRSLIDEIVSNKSSAKVSPAAVSAVLAMKPAP